MPCSTQASSGCLRVPWLCLTVSAVQKSRVRSALGDATGPPSAEDRRQSSSRGQALDSYAENQSMTEVRAEAFVFQVNGSDHSLTVDGETPLLDVLRNTLRLKGTRFGCGSEQCGACFVLVDGHAVAACTTPLWAVKGKSVTTVEGLGRPEAPHPLQQAFILEQAAQCGYCTSGMLISAAALLARTPQPSEAEVRRALDRNLCRCGSYNRVVRAVLRAAGEP